MITERQEFYFEVAEFKKSTIYENGGFWSKLDLGATFEIKKNSHPWLWYPYVIIDGTRLYYSKIVFII